MQLLTDRSAVLAALATAACEHRPILAPNAETPDEMEAILLAAETFRRECSLPALTIGVGITSSYPEHAQLLRLSLPSTNSTGPGPVAETAETWLGWLATYARPQLFPALAVIPFLDHGWAPLPADMALMQNVEFQSRMGIIMFDASALPWQENVERTAAYVAQAGPRVIVEACPDKIPSSQEIAERSLAAEDLLTNVAQAEDFVRRTKVDLIVPNLGTEHRSPADHGTTYASHLAQKLAARLGPILSLHGTSSLGPRVATIAHDGIVKVNYYTGMARAATTALRNALADAATPLPIERAAGSFPHTTRRAAAANAVREMLGALHAAPR